jgi:hypothetical protein
MFCLGHTEAARKGKGSDDEEDDEDEGGSHEERRNRAAGGSRWGVAPNKVFVKFSLVLITKASKVFVKSCLPTRCLPTRCLLSFVEY